MSNYLWINDVPLEIQESVYPLTPDNTMLSSSLFLKGITLENDNLTNHPKLRSLEAKMDGLEVDRSLMRNKLLPKLDVQYNFLTPGADRLDSFNTANYKAFVNFSFPLFLRKERGDLKLANLKLQEAGFERVSASLTIQNKIDAANAEINSLEIQDGLLTDIVSDYETMLAAEERKFELGESSLFLINSREQKLIEATLKANTVTIETLHANASLYNALGVTNAND